MTDEKKKPFTMRRDLEMVLGPDEHQGLFKTAVLSAAELMASLGAQPIGVWIALHLVRLDENKKVEHGPTVALGLPASMPIKMRAWLTRQAADQLAEMASELEAEAQKEARHG